jgi:MoaA/NifB/PqqE/SkfB family radical SAM enzyme
MCGVVKILKGYELPKEVIKEALEEISQWGWDCRVMFTGGEPFLREDLLEVIEYSVKRNLPTEVVSNGVLIDNDLAKKIVFSGLENIAISLDGAREPTHDLIREKGSFRKAVKAIENLVEAKRKIGFGPQISVWTTMMRENVRELFEIISLIRDLGVECLVYHPVIVAQDDMQNTHRDAPFWIRGEDLKVLKEEIDRIMEYQAKYGLVAFLHDPYLWIKYFEGSLTKRDWKCNPFVFINIGPDGEVRSCGSAFGNIKKTKLSDCLNSEEACQARESMKICQKPCLQTCWAHPQSDSLEGIVKRFVSELKDCDKESKRGLLEEGLNLLSKYQRILERKALCSKNLLSP